MENKLLVVNVIDELYNVWLTLTACPRPSREYFIECIEYAFGFTLLEPYIYKYCDKLVANYASISKDYEIIADVKDVAAGLLWGAAYQNSIYRWS